MINEKACGLAVDSRIGHYRLAKRIGTGGMGEVYLAQATKLARKGVLKILPVEVATHQDGMRCLVQVQTELY